MSQRPTEAIQIKYENAINYKPDQDTDYYVSDSLQKHLKLRVLRSGTKTWVYDYLLNGRRKRHAFGELAKERKGNGMTPAQARDQVSNWEAIRKQGKNPLIEHASDVKGITLNKYFDDEFLHLRAVKPSTTAKGVRQGNSIYEYKQKISIWNKHIRKQLGDLPIKQINVKIVRDWYDNIAKKTPAHSIKVNGLAKYVMKNLLDTYEELDEITSNKFTKIKTKEVSEAVALARTKRPLTPEEFKAVWYACDEWHNPVEGLYIQFIMATSARGQAVADIKRSDIKQKDGRYWFNTLHKNKPFQIVMNELVEQTYLKTLAAVKRYPISPYLFPKYIYDSERKLIGVADTPIDSSTRQRIWRGRSTKQVKGNLVVSSNGGLRGLASKNCKTVLEVGLHDIRDTYASRSDNVEEATDMLQNRLISTTDKHYRQKDFTHHTSVGDKQLKIAKDLLK